MKIYITLICFFCCGIFLPSPTEAQSPLYQSPCTQLIWNDEFDGTSLDGTKWSYQTGDGCDINLCGWGNGELEWYTNRTENVKVENGNLVITALQESMNGKNYTSGRILTENKGDFTFGRIEARIKMPIGKGMWPAFWMLPTDWVFGAWPNSGEIDIMEYVGTNPNTATGTLHYAAPTHKYNGKTITLPGAQKFSDDFHIFAIEWDSTSIKWFMDGTNFHTMTSNDVYPGEWVFKERFNIILNLAIGGLGGDPDGTTVWPQTLQVDYVRVYSIPFNTTIEGKSVVFQGDVKIYSLPGDPDITNYQWQVPAGATINSGQGTNTIEVTWGNTSGDVSVLATKSCDDFTQQLAVTVITNNTCELVYTDFEANKNINLSYYQGVFTPDVSTYNPDSVNSSTKMGRYQRSVQTTDKIIFNDWPMEDPTKFESGEKIFYLDLYTTAPIGTTVEIQMQNAAKASGVFPAGRRNSFITQTSVRNKWERLVFKFNGIKDASTLPGEVDNIVLMFDPGSTTPKPYYFDNFKRGNVQAKDITGNATVSCNSLGQTYSVPLDVNSTYNWSVPSGAAIASGQGTNAITVNWGNNAGYVTLKETDGASCQAISANYLVTLTGCPTSISNSQVELAQTNIYPNPVRDNLSVECNLQKLTDVEIIVSNLLGENLIEKNYSGESGNFMDKINIQELKAGIYYIQIKTSYGSSFRKFIKE